MSGGGIVPSAITFLKIVSEPVAAGLSQVSVLRTVSVAVVLAEMVTGGGGEISVDQDALPPWQPSTCRIEASWSSVGVQALPATMPFNVVPVLPGEIGKA